MNIRPIVSSDRYKHFVSYYPIGKVDTKIRKLKENTLTIKTEYIGNEMTRKLYWLEDKFGKLIGYKYLMLENNKVRKILGKNL